MEDMIQTLRWAAATLLLTAFLVLSLYNWCVFWRGIVRRQHTGSWVPLFGGSLGALGFVAVPLPETFGFWWVPLLLDWGCAPGILHALLYHAAAWVSSRPRIVRVVHGTVRRPQKATSARRRVPSTTGECRIACPRCEQDWLVHVKLVYLDTSGVLCPECDALWTGGELRAGGFTDYGTYMRQHGRANPQDPAEIEITGFVTGR